MNEPDVRGPTIETQGQGPSPPAGEAPAPPRRRRGLGWLWRALLALLLPVGAAVGFLLGTEKGLQLGLDAASRVLAGELETAHVSGRLIGPLEVRGLRFRDTAVEVEVERLAFDWRPSEVLLGRLHVLDLALEGVRVATAAGEAQAAPPPEPGPAALPEVSLPLEVAVDRLRIADARLVREGLPPLEELRLRASAAGQRATLGELALRIPGFRLDASGGIGLGAREPADLSLAWQWQAPGGESLEGRGRLSGPIPDLRLEHRVTGAAEASVEARVEGLPAAPRWDARVDLIRVEPARLVAGVPPLTIAGRLESRGTPGDLGAGGGLDVAAGALGTYRIDLATALAGDRLRVERVEITRPGTATLLRLDGEARLGETPEFRAQARWEALQWPPEGAPRAASPEGRLTAEGDLDRFRFGADAQVTAEGAPPTRVRLRGAGDPKGARVEELLLDLLDGQVRVEGEVGWVPEPRWDLRVALADLDPGRQWADWPGKLGGGLQTRGFVEGAGPRAKIDLTAIEGILRGYPFRLTAGAETEGREATLDRLVLTSGEARVSASGKVGEALALEWKVSAPSIEQLIPGAAGSLSGEGRVAGTVGRPRLVARLQGSGLALNENRLGRLEADVDLGLARDDAFRLTLDALGLAPGGKRVGDLAVRGTGSPSEHRVTLDLTGGDLGLGAAVALAGGLREDGAWAGRLERADLGAGRWGDWRLASPAALALGRTVRAEPLCWASGEARVCAAGSTGEGRSWKGELTVSALPLGLLQSLLPKELEVAGALEARVTASGTANGGLRAQASLSLPGAALTVPMGEERRRLDLSRGTLQARVDDRGISVSTALYLGDLADLDAGLDLPGWTPAVAVLDRQRVTARLKARVPDLAWVRAFAPALGAVGGQVAVDLSVGGTLGAPRLSGQAALSDARAEVPDAGLALEGLRLSARAEGASRLVYEGGVRSGEGDLALAGETLLDPAKGFPTRLEVKGKEFVAVNTSEFWALVSPDLRLDRDAAGARVEGEVFVPRARIRPRGVPKGAVAPSRDVVVRGEGEEGRGAGVPVAASVRLRLGDQVSFDGIGLRGRFEGDLLVVQTPPRDPIGNGKIGIVSGVYSGLGTDLEVERGSVNYASSPLDNPGLDVKAVKRTQEVVAGVRVTGTAQDPKVQVFSEPPRPQSEVLSYLLFGRPMGGGSGTDKAQLQNAAALAGGGLLAAEVGRQLGLEEFRLGGAEGGGAALTVGQYVTPQIYLQYVTGIRSALNRLRIRYDITKRIQLQTETGDQQAADVFYIFER